MFRKAVRPFYREADTGAGSGNRVPAQIVSVSDMMAGAPDNPDSGAVEPTPAEPKQRRAKAKADVDDQGASEKPDSANVDPPVDDEAEDVVTEPSNEDYKALHEAKAASNKKLRADNDNLRKSVAEFEQDATTFRGIQAMLNDKDPKNFAEGMKFLLEAAAAQFGGDVTKALEAAGYEAKPRQAVNPFDEKREAVKAKVTDPTKLEEYGWQPSEVDMVARMNADLVDSIFEAMATAVPQVQAPTGPRTTAGAPAPGGDNAVGTFDNEHRAALQAIQEEAPLFEVSRAEAEEARRRYPLVTGLDLESAIRLTFRQRLDEEKAKQNAGNVVKPMVKSNGKVGGTSVLDPDRIAAGPISLSEAYESFKDKPTGH